MIGNVLFDFFDGVSETLLRIWEAHGLAICAALVIGLIIGLITKSNGLTTEQQIAVKQMLESREEAWKHEVESGKCEWLEKRIMTHSCVCCRQSQTPRGSGGIGWDMPHEAIEKESNV